MDGSPTITFAALVLNGSQAITFEALVQSAALIIGIWGFYNVIMQIIKNITDRHDKEKAWDNAVEETKKERELLAKTFNIRLDDITKMIEDNQMESDSKIQELTSIVIMLTKSVKAILDGQVEQGLNGTVKKQRDEVDNFLTELIGK